MHARINDLHAMAMRVRCSFAAAGLVCLAISASASPPVVVSIACPAALTPAPTLCGSIAVPRDRGQPVRGTLSVGFALYSPSGNKIGTIAARQGGPGPSSTAPQFVRRVRGVMAPLAASGYSLLFVDQRGRGLSSAIDCEPLQHAGVTPASVTSCASSLLDAGGVPGSGAGDYSSAAAADDLEDVRAALVASGLIASSPIDLFGQSYGGVDLEAYAARYPQNVRTLVGDSPYTSEGDFFNVKGAGSIASGVINACALNPGCVPDYLSVAALATVLRLRPDVGTGVDYTGTVQNIAATESALLTSVLANQPAPGIAQLGEESLNQGEVSAAARAYLLGDKAPLFRLLAENLPVLAPVDFGSVARYSGGANIATICADTTNAPWTWGSPGAQNQYNAALARLSPLQIAPFSATAWNDVLRSFFLADTCVPWPSAPIAAIPPNSPRTSAPVLALSGNMDISVPTFYADQWASRYPTHTLVRLNGRAHIPAVRGDACAQGLIRAFIANPSAQLDTSCATQPQILPLATAAFPLYSIAARPADKDKSVATDKSRLLERQLAAVAVSTILDGFKRFSMAADPTAVPAFANLGLRGGGVTGAFNDDGTFTLTYAGARFVQDVSVSGTVSWDPFGYGISGTVTLAGVSGGTIGTLSIAGTWRMPGQSPLQVRGTLNGRPVAVLVPAI
jgi:pimeloyl-ACP methyl ester carboxylesterase